MLRERRRAKIDAYVVANETGRQKIFVDVTIERARNFTSDPKREQRHAMALCPPCYYIRSRIGGAMLTSVQCAECDKILQFSNTATDVLCETCAKRLGLCKHCGADLDLKHRRKPREFRSRK